MELSDSTKTMLSGLFGLVIGTLITLPGIQQSTKKTLDTTRQLGEVSGFINTLIDFQKIFQADLAKARCTIIFE